MGGREGRVGKPNTNTLTWKAEAQFASIFPDSPEGLKRGRQRPRKNDQFKAIKYTMTFCPNTEWAVLIGRHLLAERRRRVI